MMVKVRNVTPNTLELNGVLVLPGETKLVPEGGVTGYAYANGKIQLIKDNVRLHERSNLEDLSMSKLREIGAPMGAKDTKKSELIEEILKKEGENYG